MRISSFKIDTLSGWLIYKCAFSLTQSKNLQNLIKLSKFTFN